MEEGGRGEEPTSRLLSPPLPPSPTTGEGDNDGMEEAVEEGEKEGEEAVAVVVVTASERAVKV